MPLELELCPGRWVGGQHPCFIIAEIGQNHQGDLDVAKRMIRMAKVRRELPVPGIRAPGGAGPREARATRLPQLGTLVRPPPACEFRFRNPSDPSSSPRPPPS